LEELFYWLVILAFYLFSAYRSRKKKVIPPPIEKEIEDTIPDVPPPQTKSVLDFLNDAFEKMETEVDEIKIPQPVQDQSMHHIKPSFEEHFDDMHDMSKVDDRHLGPLQSRIKHTRTKYDSFHDKPKIKILQEKYSNNPLKLGIIMQTIFDKPKAMQQ
tara:strand:+ start:196 stop:669 length:474 start_codon:yes stop_codon:yes gene_type:complete